MRDDDDSTDASDLRAIAKLIVSVGAKEGIEFAEIRGNYSSSETIIDSIYRRIQDAELVVVVVRDPNPNVFFEAGYAAGWNKSIFYVAQVGRQVPFNISGLEHFEYDPKKTNNAELMSRAMQLCIQTREHGLTAGSDFIQARRQLEKIEVGFDLFGLCLRHTLKNLGDWVSRWTDMSIVFSGSQNILEIGTFVLKRLKSGGFATQDYAGQESWAADNDPQTDDQYFLQTREAVARGCAITRVYVVDDPDRVHEQRFRDIVWTDIAAGIKVTFITERELPPGAKDFGLWDDELLAEVQYSTAEGTLPQLSRATYTNVRNRSTEARQWKTFIEYHQKPVFDLPNEGLLLQESVRETDEAGAQHCESNARGKQNCSDYHMPWQTLRLCDVVSTPSWHCDFYRSAFGSWVKRVGATQNDRKFNILISGLADFGMLYWAAQCIEHKVRQRCTFHVLDICETPLQQCEWLQIQLKRRNPSMSLDVITIPSDILDSGLSAGEFDVIVSDAFLTRFEDLETKRLVVKEWCRLLVPDGAIITTARHGREIRPIDRDTFVEAAVNQAKVAEFDLDPETTLEKAEAYARHVKSFPFANRDTVRRFLAEFDDSHESVVRFDLLQRQEMTQSSYARIELIPRTR